MTDGTLIRCRPSSPASVTVCFAIAPSRRPTANCRLAVVTASLRSRDESRDRIALCVQDAGVDLTALREQDIPHPPNSIQELLAFGQDGAEFPQFCGDVAEGGVRSRKVGGVDGDPEPGEQAVHQIRRDRRPKPINEPSGAANNPFGLDPLNRGPDTREAAHRPPGEPADEPSPAGEQLPDGGRGQRELGIALFGEAAQLRRPFAAEAARKGPDRGATRAERRPGQPAHGSSSKGGSAFGGDARREGQRLDGGPDTLTGRLGWPLRLLFSPSLPLFEEFPRAWRH